MTNLQAHLIDQLNYSQWAAERFVQSLDGSDIQTNERVLWLFNHAHTARTFWLERLKKQSAVFTETTLSIKEVIAEMAVVTQNWIEFIGQLSDEQLLEIRSFIRPNGMQMDYQVLAVATQIINHNTHHFGELIPIMRSVGITPLQTDYIYYYFNRKK